MCGEKSPGMISSKEMVVEQVFSKASSCDQFLSADLFLSRSRFLLASCLWNIALAVNRDG